MDTIRRVVVTLTLASLLTAGALGIALVLTGDLFGDTTIRVLLTTVVVGVECIALLAYLSVVGPAAPSTRRAIGALLAGAGVAASLAPTALALTSIWFLYDWSELLFKLFATTSLVALGLAQACLLLRLSGARREASFRVGLAAQAVGAALTGLAVVMTNLEIEAEGAVRALVALIILDVVGLLATMVLATARRFALTARPSGPAAGGSPSIGSPRTPGSPSTAR